MPKEHMKAMFAGEVPKIFLTEGNKRLDDVKVMGKLYE